MIYRFAEFELDTDQSRLTRGAEEVPLQPKVFEALLLLARNPGQLVTKQELMDALWPETFVNEEALAQIIFKLRRSLGDTRGEPRFVQTVLKRGFRFLPDVSVDPDDRAIKPHPKERSDENGQEKSAALGQATGSASSDLPQPDEPTTLALLVKEANLEKVQKQNAEANGLRAAGARGGVEAARPWRGRVLYGLIGVLLIAGSSVAIRQWLVSHRRPVSPLVDGEHRQRVRRVTFFPERDEDADIAPNGKSLVFVSKHGGDGLFKLYWMNTSGGDPLRLTRSNVEEQTPRFSPNGDWIVYRRDSEGGSGHSVWRVAATGGQESLLAPDAALPDWSPDGREILFVRGLANGEYALMRMSLEDRTERLILTRAELMDMPAWSPDGSRIAFVSREALWVVTAEGDEARRVTERDVTVQTLTWAPDSKAIICDATWGGRRNLWMIPLEGDSPPVPITAGSGVDIYPSITPDWKYLLYTNEQWQRLVWIVDKSGRHPVKIPSKTTFESISIDSTGRWLAYSDFEPEHEAPSTGNAMGLLDVKTLEQRRLGFGDFPVFSPDGKRLAFLREDKEGSKLYVMELETGSSRRVSQTLALRIEPAWSRDGTRIVFHRSDNAKNPGLTIVELASGHETPLAEGNYSSPEWSPDGQWIAASGTGSDGRGLYIFDMNNLQPKRISETCSYEAAPIWASDSRSVQILVDERKRPALLTLSVNGVSSSRLELEFSPDPSFWGIFHVKPTPDGYVYLLQRVEGDIYMAEHPGRSQ